MPQSVIPLGQVISTRRMMYLQNILKRPDGEMLKGVYEAQKSNPVRGDWIELVKGDFENMGISLDEAEIQACTKSEFKIKVKSAVKEYVFDKLKKLQEGHSKISNICYKNFKVQNYMTNHTLNNHEVSLLFSLRSRTASIFKANFPYNAEQMCPLGCPEVDSQEHCLLCEKLYPKDTRDVSIVYNNIFSDDTTKQAEVVKLFATLLERREDASSSSTGPSHSSVQGNDSN